MSPESHAEQRIRHPESQGHLASYGELLDPLESILAGETEVPDFEAKWSGRIKRNRHYGSWGGVGDAENPDVER
jgi:hypothetical protein